MVATALPKNECIIFFFGASCENLAYSIFVDIHKGFFSV